jgi:hypothetical protein
MRGKEKMKWMRHLALFGLLTVGAFALAACSDDNPSGPEIPDPPAAPTGVNLSVTGQSITVSWAAAAGAETYEVVLTTAGEADRTQDNLNITTATFANLTPGTTYFAQVTASNTGGTSAPATGTATTEEEPETVVQVTQDILTNTTWTSDKIWVLNQPIFVGRDCGTDGSKEGCIAATLTIEPGTTILGKSDVPQGVRGAYLVVSRGSRLVADATSGEDRRPTEDEVIVFTSDKPKGQRAVEDWGGLIINGQAPTNAGDEAQGEGDSGFYGGPDEMDDSGIIRGVRIEFAGDDVTPADQLNGLALQGVGAGTTISYVQIHYNKDDGIEPFGGTVSVDHLVVTGIGDDSVDGTDGYRGFIQFIIGQQRGADADNGFEISNNGDDESATPKSTAVLANATMIGARTGLVDGDIAGAESDDAIQMREGTNYRVYNSVFQGFGNSGLCIRDAVSIVNAQNRLGGDSEPTNTLSAEGLILWGNGAVGGSDANFNACGGGSTVDLNKGFFENAGFNNTVADPGFDASVFNMGTQASPPDFTLAAMPGGYTPFDLSGIAYDANLIAPADGRRLVETDYAGAIAPGTALADAWYYGWTIWASNGSDSRPNADGN